MQMLRVDERLPFDGTRGTKAILASVTSPAASEMGTNLMPVSHCGKV
jgi:hypothetical protein